MVTTKIPLVHSPDRLVNQLQQNIRAAVEPYLVSDNFVSSLVTTGISAAATTAWLSLTSLTLSPGSWDIAVAADVSANGATLTNMYAAVSTSTGVGGVQSPYDQTSLAGLSPTEATLVISRYTVTPTSTTTYYLNVRADYTGGTPTWSGFISARQAAS